MSEETPSTDAPEVESEEAATTELSADDLRRELEKTRKEAAKYRTKARDLEPLAKKAQEIEESSKTAEQRLSEALAAAEERAATAERNLLIAEVAAEKGLTPALARRLQGSTKEELVADADELLEAFPQPQEPAPAPTRKPKANLKGGSDPTEPALEMDPQKLAAMIGERQWRAF